MTFADLKKRLALLFFLLAGLIGSIFSAYSCKVLSDSRANEIDFVLTAAESGPVEFARLHSAELSQARLDSLMRSPGLRSTSIRSLRVVSGQNGADIFASWKSNVATPENCAASIERDYVFESSLYPISVILGYDHCFSSQMALENVWLVFGIAALILLVFLFSFDRLVSPLIESLRISHSLLSPGIGKGQATLLERIRFLPARELASKALESIELEKTAAIARTTQNLAHDVRKPFSMLKLVLGAISDAEDPNEAKEIAKASLPEVNQAMASVEGMIQDVMQIGSSSKPNQEPASCEAMIDAAVNELFRIFPEADVGIDYDLNHRRCLFIDTMRVGRVFSNILVNAVQAMNGKGNLWIKTQEENGFVEFRLGNVGSCIPKDSFRSWSRFGSPKAHE